ncbi:MAG: nuclear transport factor 2 family protein, partial [Kiloniellales bacterium]|nr:nuclear transport factor 2 family protein [Kiloniellales bacterium]
MTEARDLAAAVAAYANFYETLTPESLERLDALCAADVRFRDPFNDVSGVAAYRAILADMFQ